MISSRSPSICPIARLTVRMKDVAFIPKAISSGRRALTKAATRERACADHGIDRHVCADSGHRAARCARSDGALTASITPSGTCAPAALSKKMQEPGGAQGRELPAQRLDREVARSLISWRPAGADGGADDPPCAATKRSISAVGIVEMHRGADVVVPEGGHDVLLQEACAKSPAASRDGTATMGPRRASSAGVTAGHPMRVKPSMQRRVSARTAASMASVPVSRMIFRPASAA